MFLVPPGGGWPVGPGGVCPRTELERPCSEVWGCDEAIHPPPLRGFPPRRGDLTLRDSRLLGCGHAAPGFPWLAIPPKELTTEFTEFHGKGTREFDMDEQDAQDIPEQ